MARFQRLPGIRRVRPLNVAVIFDEAIQAGGGYQQALNAALLVRKLSPDLVNPVYFSTVFENVDTLKAYGIDARPLALSSWQKAVVRLRRGIVYRPLFRALQRIAPVNPFERLLKNSKIDLVYFLSANEMVNDLEDLNFVVTVWDLCHRDAPEFPEVRADRIFEKRERLYNRILPKAVGVLVDSPLGKENVVRRYQVDAERVHVLPFSPAEATRAGGGDSTRNETDVSDKYDLTVPYVFYPAQFWPHKNHVYLLHGLSVLEKTFGQRVGAIFTGSDKGNLQHVRKVCSELGLTDRIRFAGFVPNEEIPQLYCQSIALVMPSYFGPTNLPPLEAFSLGVPVLYSDLEGLRDQVGDAALLMDLKDPASMASHLNQLLTIEETGKSLIRKGKERLSTLGDDDRLSKLDVVFTSFRYRRQCWGGSFTDSNGI